MFGGESERLASAMERSFQGGVTCSMPERSANPCARPSVRIPTDRGGARGADYQPNRAWGRSMPESSAQAPHRSIRLAPGRSEAATRLQP